MSDVKMYVLPISGYLAWPDWTPTRDDHPRRRVWWPTGLHHEAEYVTGEVETVGLVFGGFAHVKPHAIIGWRVVSDEYTIRVDGEEYSYPKGALLHRVPLPGTFRGRVPDSGKAAWTWEVDPSEVVLCECREGGNDA